MNKAEELIACLEGEIAKRDARISELEDLGAEWVNKALAYSTELSAIKAQEPVAWAATARKKGVTDQRAFCPSEAATDEWISHYIGLSCDVTKTPLYAAPVSEAKAQGVVMPERTAIRMPPRMWDDQDAESPEFARGHNAALGYVARLNAAPVQQVSVPDGRVKFSRFLTDAMTAAGLLRHGKTDKALASRISSASMEYMLDAAPAAQAADAVNERIENVWIGGSADAAPGGE